MTPIYIIGSSNTDMLVRSERITAPGETVLGGTFFMNPGGKGANQAVAAARLGGTVTLIATDHVPDPVYAEARAQFDEKELADLTFAITTINAWNRLAIAARTVPGSYNRAQTAPVT